jgi:hypothetical protein
MANEFGDPLPRDCRVIEVHVGELNQLFNAMDPAPFRDRDLDPNADAFIVESAKEMSERDGPLALVVYVDRETVTQDAATVVKDAVHQYFANRARATRLTLRELFSRGRTSLAIGLFFVVATVLASDLVQNSFEGRRFTNVISESLVIAGWVAMWRPLEVFLYDWWPIRAEARLYLKLSEMPVRLVHHEHDH